MKRIGNVYQIICSVENLQLADAIAQLGKKDQVGVRQHNAKSETNVLALHERLKNEDYKTSNYSIFKIFEPKERTIYRLPYYPDRIMHHAIMNVLEPIFIPIFTTDTYSCIKGRGVHGAVKAIKQSLKDVQGTKYCLKLDIKKFYPSVDHAILKRMLRRKFKDTNLLALLDEIIDSAGGLPIGNYLSQYLANFYLSYFDHWLKERKGVKHYFRYSDDMVILSSNKEYLHALLADIKIYLKEVLNLELNSNYQVFPVDKRGIDFVGYRFFHKYTLLRKRIKQRFARMLVKRKNVASIGAYYGWSTHCNSKNLLKKLLTYEDLCRLQNKTRTNTLRWRKDKSSQNIRQTNTGECIQDRDL